MDIKLFDSELKVMDVLWKQGDTPAREIARALGEELGWNVNTTYTLIKRCMKKGAIERTEPGFLCHALLPKAAVQEAETDELINKIYDGSADKLFAALLGRKNVFFVPFGQDDCRGKPASLVADFSQVPETVEAALRGEQLQPLLLGPER